MSNLSKPPPTGSNTRLHSHHPSIEELIVAIKSRLGLDQVNAEMLKACPYFSTSALQPLVVKIWREEKIPDDWLEDVLVIDSKKGDLSECRNYRGIMLL